MVNDEIVRGRHIRAAMLNMLYSIDGACGGSSERIGMSFRDIRDSFRSRRQSIGEGEIQRRALTSLTGQELIDVSWDDTSECDRFFITPRGMDFKIAGMPWERIDDFTGAKT